MPHRGYRILTKPLPVISKRNRNKIGVDIDMMVSVVIRTYNEERYLDELLTGISEQSVDCRSIEVIVVDSGSIDGTIDIAREHGCRVVSISKSEFTFGRSLNIGCEFASGSILVFVSGHCVPASRFWLENLIAPLEAGEAAYAYGRQLGWNTTKFSEQQVFSKYFPETNQIPQNGFFCNNANAALLKSVWERMRFDETLTGLEDLQLAKALVGDGHRIAYVADSPVFHIHNESWRQVRLRYEREALALREIMPEVHVSFADFLRYFSTGVLHDMRVALRKRQLTGHVQEIVLFRLMQFWGTYRGNLEHRQLSARKREEYFFPAKSRRKKSATKLGRPSATESS